MKIVAHLMAPEPPLTRFTFDELEGFFEGLTWPQKVMSSSPGTIAHIRSLAVTAARELSSTHGYGRTAIVDPSDAEHLLAPFRTIVGAYDVYLMAVGSWRDTAILERFAEEAAHLPGHGLLVLIPNFYDPDENIRIFDPSKGVKEAIANRGDWPGILVVLRSGESYFFGLDEAYRRLAAVARTLDRQESGHIGQPRRMEELRAILSANDKSTDHRRRILHLSDLHLGTAHAARMQMYLQIQIQERLASIDRVVVTGDLFDQPRPEAVQQFLNFRDQIELAGAKRPVVVPGNHDQRLYGNSIGGLGNRFRELIKIDFHQVVVDEAAKIVFVCFDSSASGDFARGEIDTDQLIRVATRLDLEDAHQRLSGYLRVAVLHHHPYPFPRSPEIQVVDPRTWLNPERFLELRGAEQFLSWCGGRGIELILHGHKHVPRLVIDEIRTMNQVPKYRQMTTVGCGSSLGANGAPLSFNIVDWDPTSMTCSVDFKVDRGDGQGFFSAMIESPSPMRAN